MFVYIYIYTCTGICSCIHICKRSCRYVCVYIYVYVYRYLLMLTWVRLAWRPRNLHGRFFLVVCTLRWPSPISSRIDKPSNTLTFEDAGVDTRR